MLRIFLALSLTFLFIACDSDDDTTPEMEVEVENFYGLTVGNTYTYSYHRRVGDTEEFETLALTSNVVITDEVIINGESYFEFTATTTGDDNVSTPDVEVGVKVTTVKEVEGVLQNDEGQVLFSNIQDSDPYLISENEWGDIYVENVNQMQQKTVPAGNFNCDTNIRYAILEGGEQSPGSDVFLFANGIGEIYSTTSAVSNPQHLWEKRLTVYTLVE